MKIGIIGAGIAGVMCAKKLVDKNFDVILFDKSRGVSGRSTSKRWNDTGLAIDMGVPFFQYHEINQRLLPTIKDLIDENVIFEWSMEDQSKLLVGAPKMSSISRYLSKDIHIEAQQKVIRITKNHNKWQINSEDQVFDGFDKLIFSIPAPQIKLINNFPKDIIKLANKVKYDAINTLLIETSAPLWNTNEAVVYFDRKIDMIIADYKKPKRNINQFTYAIHSNKKWATENIDQLSKAIIENEILNELNTKFNLSRIDVKKSLLHQWRYGQSNKIDMVDSKTYIKSIEDETLYCCGDWCSGGSFCDAMLSGLELAEDLL
ncbi:MAG: FAD-dependent oxidoreductase [Candidatus Margulisiibacteriota bacterium]